MGAVFIKETVTRANLAAWLYSKLTSNGWTMISSKVSTDGYVFLSPGVSGDCRYLINLNFDAYSAGTNDYADAYYLLDYAPGAAGVAGTFTSRGLCTYHPPVNNFINYPTSSNLDVYYSITPDRVIFCFVSPFITLNPSAYSKQRCSTILYMGMPQLNSRPNPTSKVNCGNWLCVMLPGKVNYYIPALAYFYPSFSSSPTAITGGNSPPTSYIRSNNPFNYTPKSGKLLMTPVRINDTAYTGCDIGQLEDVYCLPSNIEHLDGDLITVNGDTYRVCLGYDNYYSSSYQNYAIRVS